jgi:hypothetical protein
VIKMSSPEKELGDKKEPNSGSVLDKAIDRLVNNIDLLIRYLMTGIVVSAALLASRADGLDLLEIFAAHPELSGVAVITIGFCAFTLYRVIAWAILDGFFWLTKQSAPSIFTAKKACGYHAPFAKFVEWRYSGKVSDGLGGYLTYRWAVIHFLLVSTTSIAIASYISQCGSWLHTYANRAPYLASPFFCLALWQFWFLLRVERELCRKDNPPAKP